MNIVGERLKTLRKEKGLTQDELARLSYITKQTISNIERGITKTVIPTVGRLLAYNLGVTEAYLSGESEERDRIINGAVPPSPYIPWDYNYEITQLLKQQDDDSIEKIMRDMTLYLMNEGKNSISIEILKRIIKILNTNDVKELKILLGITKAF